jgi:hypothetical protein
MALTLTATVLYVRRGMLELRERNKSANSSAPSSSA